jgi:hypothetical protein
LNLILGIFYEAIAKTKEGFCRLLQVVETWTKVRMRADSLFAIALKEQYCIAKR